MTGPKMDKLFFEKVLGWRYHKDERASGTGPWWTHDGSLTFELPELHKYLDLQETWVIPELVKLNLMAELSFGKRSYFAVILTAPEKYKYETEESTAPLALLTSALKALEVI